MVDVRVENHGTLFLLRPLSPEAKSWLEENVVTEEYQWFGDALVVEHSFVEAVVEGMQEEGFEVR